MVFQKWLKDRNLAKLGCDLCVNCLSCTHLIIIIYFLACRWRWTGFRCSRPRWCPCLWTSSHYARTLNCTSRVCVTPNLWRVCLQTGPEWIHSPLTSLGHRTQGRSISLSVIFSHLKTFPPRWVSRKICVLESPCQVVILKNWQRPACFFPDLWLLSHWVMEKERENELCWWECHTIVWSPSGLPEEMAVVGAERDAGNGTGVKGGMFLVVPI